MRSSPPGAATTRATAVTTTVTQIASASYGIWAATDSQPFTVPTTTSNGLLLFTYAGKTGSDTITTATYAGTSLTRLAARSQGSVRLELWYLLNPPAGTNTFTWHKTGANQNITWGLSLFSGTDQATPFSIIAQTGATSDTTGGEKTLDTSTLPTGTRFSAAVFNGSTIPTAGPTPSLGFDSLWTRHWSTTQGGASTTTYTNVTAGWTPKGSPWFDWAILAATILPTSATPGAPTNTAPPTVTTTAEGAGVLLAADPGTWSNAPTSYRYAWSGEYPDDVGCAGGLHTVGSDATLHLRFPVWSGYYHLAVTAVNASGSTTASLCVHVAPAALTFLSLPSVWIQEGGPTPHVGNSLWGGDPMLSGIPSGAPPMIRVTHMWLRCGADGLDCVTIVDSSFDRWNDAPPYTVTAADVGSRIRFLVETADSGTARPVGATSAPTAVVMP